MELEQMMRDHVAALSQVSAQGQGIIAYEFIARHGRMYTNIAQLDERDRMTPKQCYANSAAQSSILGLNYVEGLGLIEGLIPLAHAWNTDADSTAYDFTWGSSRRAVYFGVEFTQDFVDAFSERTGYCGIFESLYALRMSREEVIAYLESGVATT